MKKFFAEFKAFIKKGNVVDLAVALVIGTAFNKIVSSLVNDIIMPLVSLMVGGKDVTDWKWVIQKAVYDTEGNIVTAETALKYGVFIQAIIDFLIIALTVFIIVKLFKASTQKLAKISQTIIQETKELTKKQIKALQKLHKRASKQAKKEGKSVDEVLEEKSDEIKAITNEQSNAEDQQPKVESTDKAETPVAEQKFETSIEQPVEEASTVTKDDEILLVLREIRDSLKTNTK